MKLKLLTLGAAIVVSSTAMAATEIEFWHAMGGELEQSLNRITDDFNASQDEYVVKPTYKGNYSDTMTAAISAFRAKQQPEIVQVYEVGTATMMNAKGAIYPVEDLMDKYADGLDHSRYLPAVISYYQSPEGKLLSMPFNSSTVVMWYNKDAFAKAGIENPPKTWGELDSTANKLREAGYNCGFSTSWQPWFLIENYSAWNNIELGTLENGFQGLKTELRFNNEHIINRLQKIKDSGNFVYGGRQSSSMPLFVNEECPIWFGSSGSYSGIKEQASFDFGEAMIPYDEEVTDAPQNSIIGGATLWVLSGHKDEDYKGTAAFLEFLSRPEIQARWHQETGYVPITHEAYELSKEQGHYDRFPGADVPIQELSLNEPTVNSRGLRFGNYVQIRDVLDSEMENIWNGKKTAKEAMNDAAEKANNLLRQFEKANK